MQGLYRWLWLLLPANPILVRIVQGGSRQLRHLWVRMGYLGALIVLVLIGLLIGEGLGHQKGLNELAKAGTWVFAIVSYGQVALVCLLAPLFMAGAISQEQTGKSYDILLTTPLSNLQIVIGSLLGRLFFVASLLLSGLPLFAVLLIFGGVPMRSILMSFAVALLAALMVGSVAVTLAVLRKGGHTAVFVFVVAIAGYLVASYALDRLVRFARMTKVTTTAVALTEADGTAASPAPETTGRDGRTTWLTPLHPLLVLESSLNRANYRPPDAADLAGRHPLIGFYLGRPEEAFAVITLIISLALIVFSAISLRAIGQGPSAAVWVIWLRRFLRLHGPGERRRPARQVWANPIAWVEARARVNRFGGILARWSFVVIGVGIAAVLLLLYHNSELPRVTVQSGTVSQDRVFRWMLLGILLVELAIIVLVAIYMSAGSVSREREDGTLDLLLSTPITPNQYIWGKMRGLVSFLGTMFSVPVLTLAMVAIYTVIGNWLQWPQSTVSVTTGAGARARTPLLYSEVVLLMPLMLVPFLALCVAVGMSWSLKAKNVLGAVVPSVGILGALMVVLGFCGMSVVEVPLVGPMINAFSPTTNVVMLLDPWQTIDGFADAPGNGRLGMTAAAFVAGAGYSFFVYVLIQGMVRGFDHTVRRLSGTT